MPEVSFTNLVIVAAIAVAGAIGYGFLIPVFFIASGLRFDLQALLDSPSAIARVPLFLLALLVVRALPAALYRSTIGRRGAIAAGLLQATSLPALTSIEPTAPLLRRAP